MLRHERLEKLTRTLTERESWTATGLAEHLEVSLRTVMRDLDELRAQSVPIESDPGRGGGVRLSPTWGFRKFQLSDQEALSLLLSIAVYENLNTPLFESDFKQLRQRMFQSLSDTQKKKIRNLKSRIFIGQPSAEKAIREKISIRELEKPFTNCLKIQIDYEDKASRTTSREVEPHALIFNWPIWYLLTWDNLREAPRTFRIDRIQKIKTLETRFVPRPLELVSSLAVELRGFSL